MTTRTQDRHGPWLLAATFVVALAGLVYELIAGAVASYLLGDSVLQFSLVIGIFMSAMGLGAWASRLVENVEIAFTRSQILLGLVGGFSAPLLFLAYAYLETLEPILFGTVIAIGFLSGLEIPLITRILQREGKLKVTLSNVLTADYAGALLAAVLFPLLVVPNLGLMAASLFFGVLNLGVAALSLWMFRAKIGAGLRALWTAGLVACLIGLWQSERLVTLTDTALYADEIILSERTRYQQITITRHRDRTRLFLDGSIQFDSLDEYRYHESLVHPAMRASLRRRNILILGGGDGMAAREVLRWAEVEQITLVDLDPRMTELFRDRDDLASLNGSSLRDPRVSIVNRDAWSFVEDDRQVYDAIILDLPDPSTLTISKLYSIEFYSRLMQRLSANGVLVTQAGSPLFARAAFWSIAETLGQTTIPSRPGQRLAIHPYHAYVPSFGDWGFVMASAGALSRNTSTWPKGLRFLGRDTWPEMQTFPVDTGPVDVPVNSLTGHALVRLYREGWSRWFE